MATTYTESAGKATVTATGEAPPYTTEEAYNRLVAGEVGWNTLVDALDDTAAATASVPVGSLYRTGSVIKVRVA